jgi:DNA-binding response OmpR family regulator
MHTVLLSAAPTANVEPSRAALAAADFEVRPHMLASTPAVDLTSLAVAIICVGERVEHAAAQTRRWRLELGDQIVPILWLIANPDHAATGLDAGAEACLPHEVTGPTLIAQVKALARTQAAASRLGMKAGESLLLGEQLRKARSQLDRDCDLARRIHRGCSHAELPAVGPLRFAVAHRTRSAHGGDFHEVRRLDEAHVGFFLGSVMGRAASGSLLGVFVRQAAILKQIVGNRYRLLPPEEVLLTVNRELLGLSLEEPPLVGMLAGLVNATDGTLTLARAGLPAPILIPASGEPQSWSVPGPYLGTAETSYSPLRGTLAPGDKLLIGTHGDSLLPAAAKHRTFSGQQFVDAVAAEILPQITGPDDLTLLVVEMAAGPR